MPTTAPAPTDTSAPTTSEHPSAAAPHQHVALVLPLRSPDFARAAEAVRNGVLAARDALYPTLEVVLYDSDDTASDVQAAYRSAGASGPSAIIGPLTRPAVLAISSVLEVLTPTIALNAIDQAVPPNVLMYALQIEPEARQVAMWAAAQQRTLAPSAPPSMVVVVDDSPLQKRAAAAFAEAFVAAGGRIAGTLDASAEPAAVVAKRITAIPASGAFLAVDTHYASLLRPLIRDLPVWGTSQLNTRNDRVRAIDLEGARFVDMPWLVQPDAPGVALFARSDELLRYSPDLERLYALGIDALRLAVARASDHPTGALDGVTGSLLVDPPRIERRALPVQMRDGQPMPDGS